MTNYTSVTVIYNPKSTGNGRRLATKLQKDLKQYCAVDLVPTEYAGHATEIAYKKAMASKRALVISASGDGGYNEVINGLMKARKKGAHPVARVLPAGNANDFYSNVHQNSIVKAIKKGTPKPIDILRLKSRKHGQPFVHYAHSYVGFGLTSKVGHQLNQVKLNRLNEIFIALKTTLFLHSTHIVEARQEQAYYSVVAANHRIMSKVLKMSDQASLDDGKFELVKFKKSSKWLLIKTLIEAATVGLKDRDQARNYRFKTIKPTMFQIDGEIFEIDGNSRSSIRIDKDQLDCLI